MMRTNPATSSSTRAVQMVPAAAKRPPDDRVAVLVIPTEHAQVDRHVPDQGNREHHRVADAGRDGERCPGAVQAGRGHKARHDRRRHHERINAGKAAVHQLFRADLLSMVELPQRRVHDPPRRQLAAGQHPGQEHCDERTRVHRTQPLAVDSRLTNRPPAPRGPRRCAPSETGRDRPARHARDARAPPPRSPSLRLAAGPLTNRGRRISTNPERCRAPPASALPYREPSARELGGPPRGRTGSRSCDSSPSPAKVTHTKRRTPASAIASTRFSLPRPSRVLACRGLAVPSAQMTASHQESLRPDSLSPNLWAESLVLARISRVP